MPSGQPSHLISQEHSTRGMLRRFALFPLHTFAVRTGLAKWMHDRRTKQSHATLIARGHEKLLISGDANALPQDPADLVFLYDEVRERKPERAIEFGSGQSTVFIAQALHDLGSGHLWSLDADARWLANTQAVLPEHLKPFVTFVHSPAVVDERFGIPAYKYTVVPEGEWDFVLIDGPALTPEVALSVDLIDLAPKMRRGATGMIDHRWRSAALAKEMRPQGLSITYDPSLESYLLKKS